MELRDYIHVNRLRQIDCAGQLGVTPGCFGNIVRGMRCSLDLAKRISKWSKGEVPIDSIATRPKVFVRCESCGCLRKQKVKK